jgi:hypothetical protein
MSDGPYETEDALIEAGLADEGAAPPPEPDSQDDGEDPEPDTAAGQDQEDTD